MNFKPEAMKNKKDLTILEKIEKLKSKKLFREGMNYDEIMKAYNGLDYSNDELPF